MAISVLRHPLCAGQVSIECVLCAIVLELGIDVQHDSRHLAPVCSLLIRIEHAQIRDNMLLVVNREHGIRRRGVGNVWISMRLLHKLVIEGAIAMAGKLRFASTYFSPILNAAASAI